MRGARRAGAVLLTLAGLLGVGAAQTPTRTATTVDALVSSASFFHGRAVVVRQTLLDEAEFTRLADAPKPVYVFWKERPSGSEGLVRGDFWDLGRIDPADGRFAGYDFSRLIGSVNRGQWPGRDQIYVLLGASLVPQDPPRAPSVRAIALSPDDYVEREVRVIGRFKGRNLYGDLPFALGKGKWDFVLQSADAAMWVTGVRPRGKGFDLDPSKRVDTGRWVEVTGVVKLHGVMPYVEASAIREAAAPEEEAVAVMLPAPPPAPRPEVIFSAPIQQDRDISRSAPIRIQFSRDMDPRTIKGNVTVSYVTAPGAPAPPPLPTVNVRYNDRAHAIEIEFAEPLERFQDVRVELGAGILALDGQALEPWTLTFTTGGR